MQHSGKDKYQMFQVSLMITKQKPTTDKKIRRKSKDTTMENIISQRKTAGQEERNMGQKTIKMALTSLYL